MRPSYRGFGAFRYQFLPRSNLAFSPDDQQIPGPDCLTMKGAWEGGSKACTAEDHEAWLTDIHHWRTERRIRIGYDGSRYDLPCLKWTQSSFIQPQMMVQDRYFYDPVAGKYTVDRYLDDLEKRYGGIDAVLIWPTYPNMGIDDRNQHDMIRSMPGGVAGVKQMVADFHRRGVRVLFPMMMWDQGTRDPGMSWPEAIASLMAEIDADGINGDTQDGVPLAFSLAADKIGHPLAFEPEGGPSDEAVAWNVMTWGQYQFPFAPLVDKYKWLETRHMVNISDRWNRDKTDDLQFAFFNGVGWESWENIWGIWNGITPRDGEATRRVATIERAVAPFLVSQDWEPISPMLRYGVFASRWPLGERNSLDDRESQRIRRRRRSDGSFSRRRDFATSIFITESNSSLKPVPDGKNSAYLFDRGQRLWRHSGDQHRAGCRNAGLDVENERDDGDAAVQLLARMESSAAADRPDPADESRDWRVRQGW